MLIERETFKLKRSKFGHNPQRNGQMGRGGEITRCRMQIRDSTQRRSEALCCTAGKVDVQRVSRDRGVGADFQKTNQRFFSTRRFTVVVVVVVVDLVVVVVAESVIKLVTSTST